MSTTDSETRRNKILESIIETYVSTAIPVGSEVISKKLRSSLSSATIRNIMVDLEEAGYLEQPHTSAGRVPTVRGYRFYVDSVMEPRRLSPEQLREVDQLIRPDDMELAQFLAHTAQVLAELTQEAAFVIAPTVKRSTMKQVELVPLGGQKVLCIMVASEEMFASHVVEISEPMTRDETAALVRFINTELAGLPFADLLGSLERRMLAESDTFYHLLRRSFQILNDALSIEPAERLFLEGASYVVSQPEFSRDPRKAHQLLKALESQRGLVESLSDDVAHRRGRVRIGEEIHVPGVEGCSYVVVPFTAGGEVLGGVGVLGPTRMDYPRLSALVECVSRCVSGALGQMESQ